MKDLEETLDAELSKIGWGDIKLSEPVANLTLGGIDEVVLELNFFDKENKNLGELLENFARWCQIALQEKHLQKMAKSYGLDIKINPKVSFNKEYLKK